jgi:FMN reductase [NAD(P)H]
VFPVVLLCLGYPRHVADPRRKLGVDVVVHSERYQEMGDEELLAAFEAKYPGAVVQVTEERLGQIAAVCRQAHGEAFATRCLERIDETGGINPVQRYFGLHYRANSMPAGNDVFLQALEDAGFGWFRQWVPQKSTVDDSSLSSSSGVG